MGSVGAPEVLVILVVALLVLGPERLPDAARQVGRLITELRRMSSGFQAELRDAMNSPVSYSPPPPSPSPATAAEPGAGPGEPRYLWSDLPPSTDSSDAPGSSG